MDVDPEVKIAFNTRISLRMREKIREYTDYMNEPLRDRLPESEEWPVSITDIIDDALTTFFAEHPLRPRKGPASVTRKETN